MLLYGVVWISLIWMYWTEVRKTEMMGRNAPASPCRAASRAEFSGDTSMSTPNTAATPGGEHSGNDIADWRLKTMLSGTTPARRSPTAPVDLVPALLCGFAVWGMWGIITVQMLNLGFPFTQAELFTLTAIAGIAGATMRIPASFLIRLAGGRNTIFLTTAMLLAPAIGTGIVLQHKDWPLWAFQ